MYDFSFNELLIVAIVAILVVGPKDLPKILAYVRNLLSKLKSLGQEVTSGLDEVINQAEVKDVASKVNEDLKTIIDLEGKEQVTYDISDFLKEDEVRRKENDANKE